VFFYSYLTCLKKKNLNNEMLTLRTITTLIGAEMVEIPEGWFELGSNKGRAVESPVCKVWLDSFLMDKCEVYYFVSNE
jgi:formylglycine-generating enzyme required for sulfatase activity